MKPEIETVFIQLIQNTIISSTHTFLVLYLNVKILIVKLETHEVSQFLKRTG